MEGLPVVGYSTGTMNSLADKLARMKNHSNSTEEFFNLTQEFKKAVLSLMADFLDKHAVPEVCMKQARELVFEIEDWIDQRKLKTNIMDPSDTEEIENFMTEMKEARERFTWYYDLLEIAPTEPGLVVAAPNNININPQLLVEEKCCLGLLDGQRDELLQYLTGDNEEMRKVVSVVGMEGLGKTTLAKEIYSEIQLGQQFQCQAFVSVSSRKSMMKTLGDILRQVTPGSQRSYHHVQQEQIIDHLRRHLSTKRYFIVIDGIWSTWVWKVINCGLPNNIGSRVLTTTCINDVGRSCCGHINDLVYQMKALSNENSTILFRCKTIALQEEEKWEGFEEDSCYMLKMGDGMPLAIIVAAGLLLANISKAPAELKMLRGSIYSSLKQRSSSDGMTKILHLSYVDLSIPLRSCFLTFSLFPENYTINKDRLIWIWGAEGFMPSRDKECLLVTGERYFNELISRRLIQPVFTCDDDQPVGCTVHIVILDFVRSISREENFATRATELMNSCPFPCDTIRRLSLDCGYEEEAVPLSASSMHLSNMRSVTVLGDVRKLYPPDSPEGDERISDFRGSYLDSRKYQKNVEDKLYRENNKERLKTDRVLNDVEGKIYPPDSPTDDERISYLEGLPSVSNHIEEMQATEARVVPTRNLSTFKHLRVLDLEDTKNLKRHHLEGIGGLVLLRYLGLAGTDIFELPEEIGELEQLETLDLRRNTQLENFPETIVKLQKLRHLMLPGCDKETKGYNKEIWEMPELEVASGIRVGTGSSSSLGTIVELLRKSEHLTMLGLILKVEPVRTTTDLVSFLDKVVKSKLQSISIDFRSDHYKVLPQLVDSWERVTAPLVEQFEPQRFELKILYTQRVPPNMGSLASLTHLHIVVGQLKTEDIIILGSLTNLVLLRLNAYEHTEKERLVIKGEIFPCLKVFSYRNSNWMGLEFEAGAMSQLQRLGRVFQANRRGDQIHPITRMDHLTCLTRVHAMLICHDATISQVEAAEASIRRQVSEVASKPTLELIKVLEGWML